MSMTPWNGDIAQCLKWMHNNAPNIQSLIALKKTWYSTYHTQFWSDWETNVFNIQTANNFGLMIWCIILGVPAQLFGLYPPTNAWAYGANRQNYVYSGLNPSLPDPNKVGGNFYGGGEFTLLTLNEIRIALQLRYAALVSNGRISYINRMLNWIFNQGQPWNIAGGKYAYALDCTATTGLAPFKLEYHFGANMGLSAQFINLMNETQYGIMPSCAGSATTVIQD